MVWGVVGFSYCGSHSRVDQPVASAVCYRLGAVTCVTSSTKGAVICVVFDSWSRPSAYSLMNFRSSPEFFKLLVLTVSCQHHRFDVHSSILLLQVYQLSLCIRTLQGSKGPDLVGLGLPLHLLRAGFP